MPITAPFTELPRWDQRDMSEWLMNRASRIGQKEFLVVPHQATSVTYAQLYSSARRCVTLLRDGLGLSEGDHVAIMLPNSAEWVVAWMASILSGCVDVGVDPDTRGDILAHLFVTAEVRAVVTDLNGLSAVMEIAPLCSQLSAIGVYGTVPGAETPEKPGSAKVVDMTETVGEADDLIHRDPRALMSIRFTSGTTGPAKAATFHGSQIAAWTTQFKVLMNYQPEDRLYTPFPLFHHLASVMGIMPTLDVGGTCILGRRFSASGYWEAAKQNGATLAHVISPAMRILLKAPPQPNDADHGIRRFYISWQDKEFETRFGARLQVAYALSEAGVLAFVPSGATDVPPGAIGTVNPDFDVRVFDPLDNQCAADQPGEIVFRPRVPFTTMRGYFGNDATTVAATLNQWFHTGDRGFIDGEGWVHFQHRMGDTIRSRGVLIPGFHVEEAAQSYQDVSEAAAIGIPSELGEFDVKLSVILVEGADLRVPEFIQWLRERLPREMMPRYLEVRESFPRTVTQKISKLALREEGEQGRTESMIRLDELGGQPR